MTERHFVYDCNGIRIGNLNGYKFHWSALRAINGALSARIQCAYDAREDKNNNLIWSTKLKQQISMLEFNHQQPNGKSK